MIKGEKTLTRIHTMRATPGKGSRSMKNETL
jgi:hypothetical protein